MALKWGIAACGNIAHDFVISLKSLPTTDHVITAVAARSLDTATTFAEKLGIPKAYEGYDKLGDDPNVDVVYVATINSKHFEVVRMFLEKGKHVLCEKPLTLNEKQTRRLVEIARARKRFLMEGLWTRCFPASKEVKRIIDSGEIGEVMQVYFELGAPRMHESRINQKELGGGVALTMGVYSIAFQQYIFRGLKPIKLTANGHLNENGVDAVTATITTYPGNKLAITAVTGLMWCKATARIYGTKGQITVDAMWAPTSFTLNGKLHEFPLPSNPDVDKLKFPNNVGLSYEAEEVRQCIRAGKLESPLITHEESIEIAQLMDKLKADVGIVYPEDLEDFDVLKNSL